MATKKDDWEDRIRLDKSGKLLDDAVEWLSDEEKKKGTYYNDRIDKLLRLKWCRAYLEGFTPTSEVMEGIEDNFAEVISEYAQHRADQDLNDEAEAEADRRQSLIDQGYVNSEDKYSTE